MEKQEKQEQCQRCGGSLGKSRDKLLCLKCLNCKARGMVCGALEWGFVEEPKAVSFILKENNGEIILCGQLRKVINEKRVPKTRTQRSETRRTGEKTELVGQVDWLYLI